MKPRLTDRILAGLIDALNEIQAGPYQDARTPAEVRAIDAAAQWIDRMQEHRAAQATTKPTARRAGADEMTRELWRQYVALDRRACSFVHWLMLKRSCTAAQAKRYAQELLDDNGGAWPADAPPETN